MKLFPVLWELARWYTHQKLQLAEMRPTLGGLEFQAFCDISNGLDARSQKRVQNWTLPVWPIWTNLTVFGQIQKVFVLVSSIIFNFKIFQNSKFENFGGGVTPPKSKIRYVRARDLGVIFRHKTHPRFVFFDISIRRRVTQAFSTKKKRFLNGYHGYPWYRRTKPGSAKNPRKNLLCSLQSASLYRQNFRNYGRKS